MVLATAYVSVIGRSSEFTHSEQCMRFAMSRIRVEMRQARTRRSRLNAGLSPGPPEAPSAPQRTKGIRGDCPLAWPALMSSIALVHARSWRS